jgi:hypothetical protein
MKVSSKNGMVNRSKAGILANCLVRESIDMSSCEIGYVTNGACGKRDRG